MRRWTRALRIGALRPGRSRCLRGDLDCCQASGSILASGPSRRTDAQERRAAAVTQVGWVRWRGEDSRPTAGVALVRQVRTPGGRSSRAFWSTRGVARRTHISLLESPHLWCRERDGPSTRNCDALAGPMNILLTADYPTPRYDYGPLQKPPFWRFWRSGWCCSGSGWRMPRRLCQRPAEGRLGVDRAARQDPVGAVPS